MGTNELNKAETQLKNMSQANTGDLDGLRETLGGRLDRGEIDDDTFNQLYLLIDRVDNLREADKERQRDGE